MDEVGICERFTSQLLKKDVNNLLAAEGAANTQVGLLQSENERIRQTSAMDILDRAGCPKISKSESKNLNASLVITPDLFDRLNLASKDAFGKDFDSNELSQANVADTRPKPEN